MMTKLVGLRRMSSFSFLCHHLCKIPEVLSWRLGKKRRRFSSDVGDSTPSHTFNDDRNDDVIFDSTMRDLSPPYASDKESKRIDILQRERINMLSKQSTPDISSGNITPLHWKTQADYYKFTKQDAAMLLKALFD